MSGDNSTNKSPRLSSSPKGLSKTVAPNLDGSSNISAEIKGELSERMAVPEVAAETSSRASQNMTGDDDDNTQTAAQKQQAILDKRAKLIAAKPSEVRMQSDIKKTVHAELKNLEKVEAKYKRAGLKASFKYNQVIARIRELRRLLIELVHSTYDQLKATWLRVVHDII